MLMSEIESENRAMLFLVSRYEVHSRSYSSTLEHSIFPQSIKGISDHARDAYLHGVPAHGRTIICWALQHSSQYSPRNATLRSTVPTQRIPCRQKQAEQNPSISILEAFLLTINDLNSSSQCLLPLLDHIP